MNTGHLWTKEKEESLQKDYANRPFRQSKRAFAKANAGKYGVSFHAIRAKLKELETRQPRDNKQEVPLDVKDGEASYEQGDNFINVVCASRRMMSVEEIIEQFGIDLAKWEVKRFEVKTSEGYRKDREVYWKVRNGTVIEGDVNDTGKMLVVPLFHIRVSFVKKVSEIRARDIVSDIKEDALNYAPQYSKIKYPKISDGLMYEIAMPDIHFGRLSWGEESGVDYDIKIAAEAVNRVLDELLSYARGYPIERILLPIGNDFFNVNSKTNTTVAGTPQQEDTRGQKTFREGRKLAISMIEKCSQIAPVDVLIIKGNHDEEKVFYMGDALYCWFHNSPDITIDNEARGRKYYSYGTNLIGFTHGSEERLDKLPLLMALEVPDMWAKSTYREFHIGHKHQKFDTSESGIVVRILRSTVAPDAWTTSKGFVGGLRAGEAFLWDKKKGLRGQFTATP
jgi:hypothetical protein